jgi:hypothetical protein
MIPTDSLGRVDGPGANNASAENLVQAKRVETKCCAWGCYLVRSTTNLKSVGGRERGSKGLPLPG